MSRFIKPGINNNEGKVAFRTMGVAKAEHRETEKVRVRFAPSPTGPLHIGGARSALFNYLLARKAGGNFIVRIEDTDLERSNRESEEDILQALQWLGIEWDEGIGKGGDYGPYRQTERLDLYQNYAQQLLDSGHAYYCYCSEDELEAERQALSAQGDTPRYLGKCRELSASEQAELAAQGRKPTIRFRVPDNQTVLIPDLVRGEVAFETAIMGDYVIVKSDGIPVYNFACVMDDYLMEITHVIRGEEHLSNTPRQILIYEALHLPKPQFAHISLILGKDYTKMSKRHGATSVVAYQNQGFLPEALVNFLVLLGWSPPGEEEIFSLAELVELFSLDRVAKNPAVFDADKLAWINGCYLRQTPLDQLAQLALPFLVKAEVMPKALNPQQEIWVRLLVEAVQERLVCLQEIVPEAQAFLAPTVEPENEEAALILQEEQVPAVIACLRQKLQDLPEPEVFIEPAQAKLWLKQVTKETKLGGRKVYMPLRVALTGKMHGTDLHYVIPLLGAKGCLDRTAKWAE